MAEILDIIVISLLLLAIVYGAMLNRKISVLQQSKKELANLFKSFDDTILQAQIGIDDLKKVNSDVSELLNNKMEKAYILIDDLSFLSEKAAKVASVMDDKVKETQKKVAKIQAPNPANTDFKTTNATNFNSPRPEEIIAMRQQNALNKSQPLTDNNIKPTVDTKKAKALESMLEQINENKKANRNASNNSNKTSSPSNSKEQNEEEIVANMLKAIGYGEN